jgi:hypothetical protein
MTLVFPEVDESGQKVPIRDQAASRDQWPEVREISTIDQRTKPC